MKALLFLLVSSLLILNVPLSSATDTSNGNPLPRSAPSHEEWPILAHPPNGPVPLADTTWYGQYTEIGGEYYAIPFDNRTEGSWTFDRGTGPLPVRNDVITDGEGWTVSDLTVQDFNYWKVIDNTLDLGAGVPAPIIAGSYSVWCGADKQESDGLCWECGPGYGNDWCHRLVSQPLSYSGTGTVTLSCVYFSQTEPCFDGTQVYLRRQDSSLLMLNPYPVGQCAGNTSYEGGDWTDSIGHYTNAIPYTRSITQGEIDGSPTVEIVFEFSSDGGWSDEDCDYATIWGGVGIDDITITGGGINESYNFESGDFQGWTPIPCDPIGAYVDIVDLSYYTILDPCACRLENNILEMHAGIGDEGVHPLEQHIMVYSPICDIATDLGEGLHTIFMELDMYGADWTYDTPTSLRPVWLYYPYTCEATGAIGWSPPTGQDAYRYFGEDPICDTWRFGGTNLGDEPGVPIPSDAEKVVAILELYVSCDAFAIDPCGNTNFTPIFDNITVGVTEGVNAPLVSIDLGTYFQDVGSYPATLFDPMAPGPANITYDLNMDSAPGTTADLCGDTLVVVGPMPGSDPNTRWEARMWWRVAKRAPLQADVEDGSPSRYAVWRDRVSDGKAIDRPDNPEFAWAWMDSAQQGPVPLRNKCASNFRENDDDFVGEGLEENEILWDDCFYPGTMIQYFITSNYAVTPNDLYHVPDTTGGFYYEFEVLPGLRTANVGDCGLGDYCIFQPATLYIDAYGGGGQYFIERALWTLFHPDESAPPATANWEPKNRAWDRYDYVDPSSNWNAPFVRGSYAGSNNGMTLDQIIGYRTILLNTGIFGGGGMQDEDFALFDSWLTTSRCNANLNRQVFIMNGDKPGSLLELPGGLDVVGHGIALMNNTLGATLLCDGFNGYSEDPDCSPENTSYCARWMPVGGGAFGTPIDVDAYGNYCPNLYGFNVYDVSGTGTGNRYFSAEDPPKDMSFAQITNQDLSPSGNYRTVLDGVSWHHMTARNPTGDPDYCPRDDASIVAAAANEISAALLWGFDAGDLGAVPLLSNTEELATCQNTWTIPTDVDNNDPAVLVNRLFQNRPNPFNPMTEIHYSLAQAGYVEVAIYDVNGRLVRTLIDGQQDAGQHSVVWDGTNDAGIKVGSGVYWSKMKTERYISNKQMVILK